jgi:hypoxanthine phosphoribosyltransferase
MDFADTPREEEGVPCELISWEQVHQFARRLAQLIREDGFEPDIIVAIGRGGLVPARILSDYLELFDLAVMKVEHYHSLHKERTATVRYPLTAVVADRRVLLVDDVSDTGDTFRIAVDHLLSRGKPEILKTAVLQHKRVSGYQPDYFAGEVIAWRWLIYPWAVIEDVSSFLREMAVRPESVEEFARHLKARHAIDVSPQVLEDVLAIYPP